MKLREIKEDNLCPICEGRLVYKRMPRAREGFILNFPFLLQCKTCNKYYREVFKDTPIYSIEPV